MMVSPLVQILTPGPLTVTVLTLVVTFLEWNGLNKVKDDGKKH